MTEHDLIASIEDVQEDLTLHIEESERVHNRLEKHDHEVSQTLKYISDHLFGEASDDIDGQVVRTGGMSAMLTTLYDAHNNGGINAKAQIPWVKVSALVTAIATLITPIMVALIT